MSFKSFSTAQKPDKDKPNDKSNDKASVEKPSVQSDKAADGVATAPKS